MGVESERETKEKYGKVRKKVINIALVAFQARDTR